MFVFAGFSVRLLDFLPLKNAMLEKLCMKWELHKNLH